MATSIEAAHHIDMGERRFRELIDAGVFIRQPRGEYDLDEIRLAYIRHLRKVAAGRGADNDASLTAARAKLTEEQTQMIAIKNAVARGEYVLVEEVCRQVEAEYAVVRERLLTIPGKVADAAAGRPREVVVDILAQEIGGALEDLSEPDRIAERARQ